MLVLVLVLVHVLVPGPGAPLSLGARPMPTSADRHGMSRAHAPAPTQGVSEGPLVPALR